jgi:lysophospholipase L1-like esterase
MTASAGRRRRFIALAMLLPVAAVAALEAALRIGGYGGSSAQVPLRFVNRERQWADEPGGPVMPDPVLFWRPRPGAVAPDGGSLIAASGFRTAFDVKKAPGVRRVVCVGDSNTFGLGVPVERTWPALLGRSLEAAHGAWRWEVLNLGVPGYTSWQIRRLLETEVGAMSPDFVVIETGGFNDWVPAVGPIDREQGVRPSSTTLRVVELVTSILGAAGATREGEGARVPLRDLATADYAGARRVPLTEFEDDLRTIVAWCAAHGARAVFVAHPLPARTVERNPISIEYAETVRRVASDGAASLADGWAAFRESRATESDLFRDFCHPTERGYGLIAPVVMAALTR